MKRKEWRGDAAKCKVHLTPYTHTLRPALTLYTHTLHPTPYAYEG